MYEGSQRSERHSIDQHGRRSEDMKSASRPSSPHHMLQAAQPSYSPDAVNAHYAVSRNDYDTNYEYEERRLEMKRQVIMTDTGHSNNAYRGSPAAPRSSYSSPAALRISQSIDGMSQYSHGEPHSINSAPPAYPPYRISGYHMESVPGAFPDYYGHQYEEQYYPPPSTSSHAYFPATPLHDESQPDLFGVTANHHHSGHRALSHGEVLPSFPQWSRTWYDGHLSSNGHAYTSVAPPPGHISWETDSYAKSGLSGGHHHHHAHTAHERQDIIREERLKMLEKEFGKPRIHHREGHDDCSEDEYDGPLPLGSVTSSGRLITERPKTVLTLRVMIAIVALSGFACGLGGALLVKTTTNAKPAPQGTLPAYLLYGCSTITLILLLYLYVFRPCCCDPMRKELKSNTASDNPLAGMVIPVLSGAAGTKPTKSKKVFGKKGRMQQQQQAPTVNLIVDPSFLNGIKGGKDESDDEEDERLPGDARRSRKRKNGLGVLGNMQLQRRWQLARSRIKLYTTWDVILLLIWIGCDVVSLGLGKTCPASAGTWCTYYNAAIACGVIIAVLLSIAIYFDYRDLKISRHAPKPPM